ncbi:transcriptional adapter 3-B [Daktulosphaira vitifoliae]|uniref:transcriptional adapter 3-B n=1 Tax=Daktulosphaira vitifoliae TaxID=58002 RepID=UPI0021A9BD14|nr:transcriptional adapter 3-B [Daktulosphaira vitifoliae]
MSPKKRSRRGGRSGRGRGVSKREGFNKNGQSLSPDELNNDENEGEELPTDISFKHIKSPMTPPKPKIEEVFEEKELSLPRLKTTNIPENSTYMSLLSREQNSGYIMTDDELDHLQWDLESMLTAVNVRKQTIKDELATFASLQLARSQQKRTKGSRYTKIRPRAAAEISPVNECRKIKVEFDPSAKELPPSKNDSANKFWTMVEPYVAPIEKEDLNWLEDLVKSYSSNMKLFEIPPLGEHYTKQWAKEEMEFQKNQSSCSPRPAKRLKLAERVSPEVVELVNKVNYVVHDGCSYTPLLQRLTAALVEETSISLEELEEDFHDIEESEDKPQEMSNVCTEFYAEQSIRKQLVKLGLLGRKCKVPPPPPPPSLPKNDDFDEVLDELKKCEASLTDLREVNKEHLSQLLEKCRQEFCRQIVKNQLEKVNDEILHFKREKNESLNKAKKISQVRKEDEQLAILLQQRSDYLRQLQMMGPEPGYQPAFLSDESELSEEGSYPTKLFIKKELNTDTEQEIDFEQHTDINLEKPMMINIKQEVVENVSIKENKIYNVSEAIGYEHNDVNVESIENEENKIINDERDEYEKIDDTSDHGDFYIESEIETKECVKAKFKIKKQGRTKDLDTNKLNLMTTRHSVKTKQSFLENDVNTKVESRKSFKIKQEPDDENSLDSSDVYCGIKRELRPRKGKHEPIYFEPYDGDTSETTESSDLSE